MRSSANFKTFSPKARTCGDREWRFDRRNEIFVKYKGKVTSSVGGVA